MIHWDGGNGANGSFTARNKLSKQEQEQKRQRREKGTDVKESKLNNTRPRKKRRREEGIDVNRSKLGEKNKKNGGEITVHTEVKAKTITRGRLILSLTTRNV